MLISIMYCGDTAFIDNLFPDTRYAIRYFYADKMADLP
jgi:hypothetical protein